jgi:phosphonate transport system permease protein
MTTAAQQAFKPNWLTRAGWLVLAAYIVYACSRLDFTWARFVTGLGNGAHFLARMFPPNIAQPDSLLKGLTESLEIAILASVLGIAIALPIGLFAARNLMPVWASWPARAIIALARSFHPVIVAILFVKAVGFGAMAGILALMVASVGFIGKLFAEAIEEISLKQVEAVRATGAPFMSLISYGVLPQVFSRFIGFATYQLDSNLRNSTMVGIVGAGGIGGTLFSAFQRFDYDFVCAILLSIIGMIMVGEVLAGVVRGIFLERRFGIFDRLDRKDPRTPHAAKRPKISSEKADD